MTTQDIAIITTTIGAIVTVIGIISKNFNQILVIFKSHKLVANLVKANTLINGHAGELNQAVKKLISSTEWSYDDLSLFGKFVADHADNAHRPYCESLVRVCIALRMSVSDCMSDANISKEGLSLLINAITTFSTIYRTMPSEHFLSVTDLLVTML